MHLYTERTFFGFDKLGSGSQGLPLALPVSYYI